MDFKKRLNKEKEELDDKILKLNSFLNSTEATKISQIQRSLLLVQSQSMVTYSCCLNERLTNL